MADDLSPTTLRRQLGAQLRELRQAEGKTAAEVARDLRFSVSKVSRMESGARAVSAADIAALVDYYCVASELADELVETARAGRRRRDAWVDVATTEGDFHQFVQSGFVDLERDAEFVREFNAGVVPGLLQTEKYMRAMMTAATISNPADVDKAIALRIGRQKRLKRSGGYAVIVDEAALLRQVGGGHVMAEQLDLLVRRSDAGEVDLRIIALSSGYHPGLNSSFVALSMGREATPDVVFVEGLVGFQKFDGDEVGRFEAVWAQLLERARTPAESREIVLERRSSYVS